MSDPQASAGPCRSRVIFDRIRAAAAPATALLQSSTYGPISSVPRTSADRLTQPDVCPSVFPDEPIPASALPAAVAPKTVLYLAYGSNLCAQTFRGQRGIRPLSQINVSAPSLRLVFDLPGLPYVEPCFANTAPRKIPKLPDPPKLPPDLPHPPINPPSTDSSRDEEGNIKTLPGDPIWDKGLVGVVYEVTPEDFAKIVATEGGGASYADILVPCLPLPPRMSVPEKPGWPELPKMFVAHTLYAPRLPGPGKPGNGEDDGEGDGGDGGDDDDDGKWKMPGWMRRWARRLVLPVRRPDQDYAQPSARYLRLIRDGAREHELPEEYQRYLWELQPYTITAMRQRVGMVIMILLFGPLFLLVGLGGKLFADETGRVPRWLAVYMTVVLNLVWITYDSTIKPVFGDGERTQKKNRHDNGRRRPLWLRRGCAGVDEEMS